MTRVGAPITGAPPHAEQERRRAALAFVGFGAITASLDLAPVRALDHGLRDLADAYRPQLAYDIAVNLNRLGSGGWLALIAAIIALGLAWRGRSLRPILTVVTAFVLVAGVIQPIKLVVHRAPPHLDLIDGLSYPSGHAVNAIVWYGVICLLLRPWLNRKTEAWVRWAPPIIVSLTGTYLGFHWLTDMLAGLCLGILIDRIVALTDRTATDRTAGPR